MSFYIPALFNPRTLARAEDLNSEFAKVSQAIEAVADVQWVGFAPFRATFAEALNDIVAGQYFLSAATGTLRTYRRISASPGYEDMGTAAVPLTADSAVALTNKTISFGSNSITMTLAQLNTALSDADVLPASVLPALATLSGTETLTGKTLDAPVIAAGTATNDAGRLVYSSGALQYGTGSAVRTLATTQGAETLTNKTISFTDNTVTMTLAQLNAAISDGDVGNAAGWTQIATTATTSGTSVTFSSIPNSYSDLLLVFAGVSAPSSVTLMIALSPDGTTFTTAQQISTVGSPSDVQYGSVFLPGYRMAAGSGHAALTPLSSNNSAVASDSFSSPRRDIIWRIAAGIQAIRVASSGSFDAGAITLYGR